MLVKNNPCCMLLQYFVSFCYTLQKAFVFFFFQHRVSQEDEDSTVHMDNISLSISELSPVFHCGDSLAVDMVHSDDKGELDLDSCLPRYLFTTFC